MSYQNRRYRVVRKDVDYVFEKRFDAPQGPEWFITKSEAIEAWRAAQVSPANPPEPPTKRGPGRPRKTEE